MYGDGACPGLRRVCSKAKGTRVPCAGSTADPPFGGDGTPSAEQKMMSIAGPERRPYVLLLLEPKPSLPCPSLCWSRGSDGLWG